MTLIGFLLNNQKYADKCKQLRGILNEPKTNFVGKDGFYWIGEVEDIEDPMELGRCKVRVLGYYTNIRGGTTADLPTGTTVGNCITTYLSSR